ncbi:MAG: helix-turn-helix domain-containing protein [Peptostreptococcaceae bacterium]
MGQFGNNLRMYRELNNLKQLELAEKLHVTNPTVCNWENGNRFPDEDSLVSICKVLNVSMNQLMGMDEQSNDLYKELIINKELLNNKEDIDTIIIALRTAFNIIKSKKGR